MTGAVDARSQAVVRRGFAAGAARYGALAVPLPIYQEAVRAAVCRSLLAAGIEPTPARFATASRDAHRGAYATQPLNVNPA